MASPLEEKFVKDNLSSGTVFEFGCSPGSFANSISNDFQVTGIDLYDCKADGFKFIKGDFLKTAISEKFDNIIAISSLEHIGIETKDFEDNSIDFKCITEAANKLIDLLKPHGKLILTVPFGDGYIYYHTENGEKKWGFRTFNKIQLMFLFERLRLKKCIVYKREPENGTYHTKDGWSKIESGHSGSGFNKNNRAVICVVFENELD